MDVGYLVGDFDLINVGHLDVLAQVRRLHAHVVAGVLSDAEIVAVTGRAPVVPEHERLAIVQSLRGVRRAVFHAEPHAREASAAFVVKGYEALVSDAVLVRPGRRTASRALRAAFEQKAVNACV